MGEVEGVCDLESEKVGPKKEVEKCDGEKKMERVERCGEVEGENGRAGNMVRERGEGSGRRYVRDIQRG